MNNLPSAPRRKRRDPSIIDNAPITPAQQTSETISDQNYLSIIGKLSAELETKNAEIDKFKGRKGVEAVVAEMIRPFSNKVYVFVVCYCVFVGILLILSGFPNFAFKLPDNVLTTLVGSTAVAVLALIGSVIAGLFKSPKRSD